MPQIGPIDAFMNDIWDHGHIDVASTQHNATLLVPVTNSNFTMIEQGLDRIAYDAAPTGDLLAQKCPRSPFHGPHGTATDVFGKSVRAAARVRHVAQMVDASSRMTHIGTRSKASCVFPFYHVGAVSSRVKAHD
ncbi:uncharacterized protein FRV6_07878 [Fusarium oxysporum]|uniref:Uncharacterized protein n=1 Tax=Fusarium oxysporum TaxID=5507 RepID=A0A2H3TDC3_FUSOX|nr:uncharacterized protein FRV6_07878 [Fusarium oxysporum]